MTIRLVLASRNEHKVRELSALLGDGVEVEPLPGAVVPPEETGTTYAANASLKAQAAASALGRAVFADDSGIEADALDGVPGVRSARYAGEDATDEENLAKLEREVPPGTGLTYVCVIAHVDATGAEQRFEGRCHGVMADARRGDGGFGYDPVFELDDGRTMAELTAEQKHAISHRGRAARELQAWLATARG